MWINLLIRTQLIEANLQFLAKMNMYSNLILEHKSKMIELKEKFNQENIKQ